MVLKLLALQLLTASPALAHTSERGFVLLLPTGYYLIGGALAVAASFLVLLLIPAERVRRWFGAHATLFPAIALNRTVTSLVSFAVLVIFVVAGFLGARDPLANPLPLTVWTLWWVGLSVAQAFISDLWRWINPWVGPYRLIRGFLGRPLVYRLGYWPAIVGFAAFAWFELVHVSPDDPAILARVVIVYSIVTWIGMSLFGEVAWLERGEAFSAFFRLVARMAPLQTDRGKVTLGIPGRALLDLEPLPPSGVLFVLLTLATVSFDGLSKTFWWLSLGGINPLEFPGRSAVMGLSTFGLATLWCVLSAAFLLSILIGNRRDFWRMAGALAISLLPISIGYQFAHYLTAFLVNAQYATVAMTDPFARGWFNTHDRMHGVTTSFLNHHAGVTLIWNLQAAGIILGHIVAVLVAHAIALRQQSGRSSAFLAEGPLALLMVAYTIFGLWLLSTPAAG